MSKLTRPAVVFAAILVLIGIAACSGPSSQEEGGDNKIVVWTGDTIPDRVAKTKAIIAKFTEASGVQVELVGVDEDQFNQLLTSAAAAGELPDVVGSQPLAAVRTLSTNELLNTEATKAVVDALGAETFSAKSLELTRDGETQLSVPSDAWSQLLYYRKDWFDKAGIKAPETYADIMAAAKALDTGKIAGFVGATTPGDAFTQQTFEQIALGNGCQMVDDQGTVTIDSPQCVAAFQFYGDLIKSYSVAGTQDVDTVRASYFAGQSAMAIWSTFLLDELAGLRNDAKPSCAECKKDPKFLAANTSVVAAIAGPDGEPAQFGEVSSWAITATAKTEPSQKFVEYMLGDGYLDWIAIAPEGKYPVRAGTKENPKQFVDAWKTLAAGVDKKAPLGDFYPQEVIDILTSGADKFSRWGITQGQGDLVGASLGELPIPKAIGALTAGTIDAAGAAKQAAAELNTIKKSLE